MTSFRHFLRLYHRTAYHFFIPPRWKNYFPFFSLLSLGIFLLVMEFLGFGRVFRYMNNLQDLPFFLIQGLLERLVGLVFLICYSMIFMSSMINGLSSFFLSQNLPFLFSLPIPRWKILALKFIENWGTSCYLILMFLSSFLLAHTYSFHLGWRQFMTGILVMILFTLCPVAMGSAVLTVLIRFFPVRRIHQVVTIFGGVFLGALMIAVRMMQPERLMNPSDTDDFVRLLKDLTIPSLNHLPSSWAAHAVVYGDHSNTLMLLLAAMASLVLLGVALHLLHATAFVYSSESRSLRGAPKARRHPVPAARGVQRALMIKEMKLFVRDATQWSQLLLLAALVVVYLLNIRNLAIQLPVVRWVVSFINLGLAGFVLAALSVRFLFPSVSMEGRSFWIVKTLPISIRRLLWSKYLIYFPPFLLFAQILVYFSNHILRVPPFFLYLSMANILGVAFALTGLAIGIGSLMPNFKTDHPSQIAIGPGGVLYMLLSFVYLALMMIIQIRPVWYWVIASSDRIHNFVYVLAAILLTLIVGLVPMEWGARRLSRHELN